MAKKIITPTVEQKKEAYIEYLRKTRKQNPEEFADFTEEKMADFIRRHDDENFTSIYDNTNHHYYEGLRKAMANNAEMRNEDNAASNIYSVHLREYAKFLDSKLFANLFKIKRVSKPKPDPDEPDSKNNDQSTTDNSPKDGGASTPEGKPEKPDKKVTPEPIIDITKETEGQRRHRAMEVLVTKRNPKLRQACLQKYGFQCQCCGMDFASTYGEELGDKFIQVHHLKLISTYKDKLPDDYVENLVPLCSNCHSMIHHIKEEEHTLRILREAYRGEKKELTVCKED